MSTSAPIFLGMNCFRWEIFENPGCHWLADLGCCSVIGQISWNPTWAWRAAVIKFLFSRILFSKHLISLCGKFRHYQTSLFGERRKQKSRFAFEKNICSKILIIFHLCCICCIGAEWWSTLAQMVRCPKQVDFDPPVELKYICSTKEAMLGCKKENPRRNWEALSYNNHHWKVMKSRHDCHKFFWKSDREAAAGSRWSTLWRTGTERALCKPCHLTRRWSVISRGGRKVWSSDSEHWRTKQSKTRRLTQNQFMHN